MRRDLLTRRDSPNKRIGLGKQDPRPLEISVQPDQDPHDEPTWEVRHPNEGRPRTGRFDGRTRSILSMAAIAAVIVNAGAVWAYWKVTASTTGSSRAGTVVELTLRGRSNLSRPLTPGGTGDLTVTLTNDNDFPIRITSVTPGKGNVVADDEHRDAGCLATGVSMTKSEFVVSWEVARNTIGAFTVPGGLRMASSANRACAGATFTVPVQTRGLSGP